MYTRYEKMTGRQLTIRMRAMRRRGALVYSDSVMAAMERENCSECSDSGLIRVRRALQQLLKAHFGQDINPALLAALARNEQGVLRGVGNGQLVRLVYP